MGFHKDSTGDNNHAVTARTYADIAARDADTAFHVTANIDKTVRVDSPLAYYIMTSTVPAWTDTSPSPDVALNTTHRASDGKDHSDVVLNNTHRVSEGSDHTFIDQDVTVAATPTFADVSIGDIKVNGAGTIENTLIGGNLIIKTNAGGAGKVVFTSPFQCSQSAVLIGTVFGGSTPNENLVLESTEDATKGNIQLLDDVAMSKDLTVTGTINGKDMSKVLTNLAGTGNDNQLMKFNNSTTDVQPAGITVSDSSVMQGVVKVQGSTAAGGDITISSTSNATKGDVFFDGSNISAVNDVTVDGTLTANSIDIGVAVAANTTHKSSDGSDHSFIDQAVTSASSPTFVDVTTTGQVLAKAGTPTSPGISFSGDLDTGITGQFSNRLDFTVGGVVGFFFSSGIMQGANNFSAGFRNVSTTATNPTLLPDRNTTNAGLGGRLGDLSLITAGVQRVEINAAGKVKHVEFTNLGSDAPAIRMKKLTGTTGATEGDNTDIAHGLTASKILSVAVLIELDTAGSFMPPGYIDSSEKQYDFFFDATNVGIRLHATNSGQLLGNSIKILITYEE